MLAEQLWLTRESPFGEQEKSRYAQLDGSETICLGDEGNQYRFFNRVARRRLIELERNFATHAAWPQVLHQELLAEGKGGSVHSEEILTPLGQDISMAARLAAKYRTVGGVLKAYREEMARCIRLAPQQAARCR